ncbi:MAG: hypothetical protein QNJ13_10645 [Paracoccaceae bacterium]|nr:hypothetical protein [Paracoccaceae bacterium]
MVDDVTDLLVAARLIRDRDLAALARAAGALATAQGREAGAAEEIERTRAALRADPALEAVRPGAFERWLQHARRKEAQLAARRAALAADHEAARSVAARSFGRVLALEALVGRG